MLLWREKKYANKFLHKLLDRLFCIVGKFATLTQCFSFESSMTCIFVHMFVQNRQKMKELKARETEALSEEDYELGNYTYLEYSTLYTFCCCPVVNGALASCIV